MTHRERGFTIIELIVTMSFMGIVIASVSELYISLRQTNRAANNLTIATQVAQGQVEKYRNTNFYNIPVGTVDVTASALGAYPSLLPPRSATVVATLVDANGLKQVDVAISYRDRTGIKNVQMSTLISYKGVNR